MRIPYGVICLALLMPTLAHGQSPPNIVFVLADDLGYGELGCYGNDFNETPNIDLLASEGMRFTQAYAAAPVCSPYRAALMTGQHPARIGILDYLRPNSANALSTDHVTLPERLRSAGYTTGMIGKWHLTGYGFHDAEYEVKPADHGFDFDFAREVKGVGNGANFWPYVFRDQPKRWLDIPDNRLGKDEFLVDRMNAEAIDFIDQNHEKPFFLYLSHFAPHSIVHGKPSLVEKYRQKHSPGKSNRERCYICQDQGYSGDPLNHWASDHNPHLAAMIESIDDGIGMISEKLTELGIEENTIFVFTSDNGGETNITTNANLRGGKSQLYEGGIRVPLIVRWPAQVKPGSSSDALTQNIDFYPSFMNAAKIVPDPDHVLDGVSLLNEWRGNPENTAESRGLYWHYPLDRPHFLGGRSAMAIRKGNWKLIEFLDDGSVELYDLEKDPSEQWNVADDNQWTVEDLRAQIRRNATSMSARTPSSPLLTEPKQLYFADHFSSSRASGRWHFNGDWSAENGVLLRSASGSENTRIFVKDPEFQNCLIRFDFRLGDSQDIRLVTGSGGHYNAVIHIRNDHFYIQTAKDPEVPYFPMRHGECAFEFSPDRWYTMTVEFLDDNLVAHIDHEHLAYAKHPMIDVKREYLAFQVDRFSAEFDNVQVLTARASRSLSASMRSIKAAANRFPVTKSKQEFDKITKDNTHARLYLNDANYRSLVHRVDELDSRNKAAFPRVFQSHKEFQKELQAERKRLHHEDAQYKELLFATHRAKRAMESYLIEQKPEIADWPDSRRKREIERLRTKHRSDAGYKELATNNENVETALQNAYPQLFVTNEQFTQVRNERRKQAQKGERFQQILKERAEAYRSQQDYLESKLVDADDQR